VFTAPLSSGSKSSASGSVPLRVKAMASRARIVSLRAAGIVSDRL
jgi:hypothetical protein